MARHKFKIGDKVRVIASVQKLNNYYIKEASKVHNKVGKIAYYYEVGSVASDRDYLLKFPFKTKGDSGIDGMESLWWFSEKFLRKEPDQMNFVY